jgi:hypothetical protein
MWLRLAPSAPSGRRFVEVQAASFAPASDPLSTTQVGTPFGEQNSLETVARRAARMPALPPFPTHCRRATQRSCHCLRDRRRRQRSCSRQRRSIRSRFKMV